MSEQLVIILLIALTFAIVLVALSIPDDPSPIAEAFDPMPAATVPRTDAGVDPPADADTARPAHVSDTRTQGAEPDDARRADVVTEEAGR